MALIFDIESDGSGSVALGAGLFSSSGTEYSAGIGDIDDVALTSGLIRRERSFTIPADIPSGTFELSGQLWPAGKIGAAGVESLAEASCQNAIEVR